MPPLAAMSGAAWRAPPEPLGRWVLITADSYDAADAFVQAQASPPSHVLGRGDLLSREGLRRLRAAAADSAVVHSPDWSVQLGPQLYEAGLLLAPVARRYVADGRRRTVERLDSSPAGIGVVRRSAEALAGLAGATVAGVSALARFRTAAAGEAMDADGTGGKPAVLAVWGGWGPASVGGSVTHISGILAAFRGLGFRVGLVTLRPPPDQLAAAVDDVELVAPLPPRSRTTGDVARLAANRVFLRAGLALASRLGPSFVYQRHEAFFTAGAHLAQRLAVPLALEFNAAVGWTRRNWEPVLGPERALNPLLDAMERAAVRTATVVVAVSDRAAEMALEIGAARERVVVAPNAVELRAVDSALAGSLPAPGETLGWIGSFGPWHGAEMLVRAMVDLPSEVTAVMIGGGQERARSEALARELGVAQRIRWTGVVPHAEGLRRLAACDVLVSPHVGVGEQPFFGSPTKLFEYMALGKPIVASDIEQLGEVLEHGRTAWLVRPGDPAELAAGIRTVLSSTDRGAGLGRRAREEAEGRHTWDHRALIVLERLMVSVPRGEARIVGGARPHDGASGREVGQANPSS